MRTIKKVEIKPIFVDEIPTDLEDNTLYISKIYKCAVHKCLCGCGNKTVTPLIKNGWVLMELNNKISLSPSIGNFQFSCKSHYILTNNVANFV